MIKKFSIAILAVTMITGSGICSANSINQVSIDPATEVLTVNGALETPCENALVDLWITDDNNKTVALRQVRTNENGEYNFSVELSGALTKGGKFKLQTIGQIEAPADYIDENGNDSVEVYLSNEIGGVLKTVSDNKDDVDSVTAALINEDNKAIIGYRIPNIKKYLDDSHAKEIAVFIKSTDMTEETAVTVLEKIAEIKTVQYGSSDEILELLKNDDCLKGLKENDTYKKMNTSYIESYASLLAKSTAAYDNEEEFMKDAVDKAVIAELCNVRGTDGTKKVLDTFAEMFDFTVYNKSGNNKDVAVSSIRRLAETNALSSCAQVQEILDTYTAESGGGTVSGGGGGGSKGSGTSVSGITGSVSSGNFSEENVKPDNKSFKDMNGYEWASDSVTKLYKAGIINGVTEDEFAPANSVTRAEFCKMIYKVFALKPANSKSAFADVNSGDWYAPYVQSLYETGAVTGVDGSNFRPENAISRQDVCALIYRLLTWEGDALSSAELSFEDADEVAEYAKEAVSSLFASGLIKGSDGKFMPNELMTRAEAAVLISRLNDYRNGVTK